MRTALAARSASSTALLTLVKNVGSFPVGEMRALHFIQHVTSMDDDSGLVNSVSASLYLQGLNTRLVRQHINVFVTFLSEINWPVAKRSTIIIRSHELLFSW